MNSNSGRFFRDWIQSGDFSCWDMCNVSPVPICHQTIHLRIVVIRLILTDKQWCVSALLTHGVDSLQSNTALYCTVTAWHYSAMSRIMWWQYEIDNTFKYHAMTVRNRQHCVKYHAMTVQNGQHCVTCHAMTVQNGQHCVTCHAMTVQNGQQYVTCHAMTVRNGQHCVTCHVMAVGNGQLVFA